MEKNVEQLVYEIHNVVVGNEEYGQEGLAKCVQRHEKTLRNHSNNWKVLTGIGIVISSTIAVLSQIKGLWR